MTPDDGELPFKYVYFENIMVKVGNGNLLSVTHTGTSVLPTRHKPLTISYVLHVHKL